MARRWCVVGMALAVMIGSATAAADVASASPFLSLAWSTSAVAPGHPMVGPGGLAVPRARSAIRNQEVGSTNWSGYAVSGSDGAYRSVSARWTAPAVTCTSGDRYASFWVGLDGYGGHSRSVEQTGTDSDCTGKTARYDGWYEMYPAAPVYFRTKVRPGDHLSASVTFHGADTYTVVLKDSTRGWSHTVTRDEPGLARSSAEVITEAPSSTRGVLPLADFGAVRFAAAKVNGKALKKLHPIKIVMIDADRLAKDSTSAFGPAGAFHNTWLRSS
ncbi:MAG TPA: G1 family glutamic endopeptidase [Streptosporangiaceae bacterium]|nr:G1 family glutamic endopeptidase [Streptosporangiaceae bacterium]